MPSSYRGASTLVMYHGTAAQYLRGILKHGLRADPPQRQYGESDHYLQTYGGVYLTPRLKQALHYVDHATSHLYQDDGLIVIVKIETRTDTIVPDEDVFLKLSDPIRFQIQQDVADQFGWPSALPIDVLQRVSSGEYDLDRWVEPWLDNILTWVRQHGAEKLDFDKTVLLRYRDELAELLWRLLVYQAAVSARLDQYQRDVLAELDISPDAAAARQDFVDAATELSRRVQRLTDPQPNLSARSIRDIGYRGANRIVGILRFGVAQEFIGVAGTVVLDRDHPLVLDAIEQIYPGAQQRRWTQDGRIVWEAKRELK